MPSCWISNCRRAKDHSDEVDSVSYGACRRLVTEDEVGTDDVTIDGSKYNGKFMKLEETRDERAESREQRAEERRWTKTGNPQNFIPFPENSRAKRRWCFSSYCSRPP